MEDKQSLFVTLYKNGEIRGSSWNINGNKRPLITELIENTVHALSKDSRFDPVELKEVEDIKIRLDIITSRDVLWDKKLKDIDPSKSGILTIKKDYENIALILPNMHPILLTWSDFIDALKSKLSVSEFKEEEYLLFEIKTETHRNF
jgi:AMMECR1 domain-containing protein